MTIGGHFGLLDVAVPFYGAGHLAAAGAEKVYDWGKDKVTDIANGGGGSTTPPPTLDPYAYTYGRDPNAANAAIDRTRQIANGGMNSGLGAQAAGGIDAQTGQNLLQTRTGDAMHFNDRNINQGDFSQQNASLNQLGGIEAQQGPSAAQAQLSAGTNQALNSQLALARSGRGFGGNAAAMGQAQSNAAGIQANNANQSAMLRAQEDAAWRQRQAANLGQVAGMQGQQVNTNLQAGLAGQAQNDAMVQSMLGMGQQGYFQGAGLQQQGYGQGMQGYQLGLQGEQVANQIQGQAMGGQQAYQDAMLRAWAAKNGFTLQAEAAKQQQDAAILQGVATVGAAAATK